MYNTLRSPAHDDSQIDEIISYLFKEGKKNYANKLLELKGNWMALRKLEEAHALAQPPTLETIILTPKHDPYSNKIIFEQRVG